MSTQHHRPLLVLLALGLATGGACNSLTGADDLAIGDPEAEDGGDGKKKKKGGDDDDDGGDEDGDGSGGAGSSSGTGTGTPTAAVSGSSGSGQTNDVYVDVAGVAITDVSFYQGVKARLVTNGAPSSPAVYVVAGRDALVRVFTDTTGYDGQPVIVRLLIDQQPAIEKYATLQVPAENDLDSTVNFEVPGASILPGSTFRVEIKRREAQAGPSWPASNYPGDASSFAATGAQNTGPLRITLVPIQYNADGSGRLPDTSAGQVQRYENLFRAIYPTSQLQLTVSAAVGWDGSISANGNGWEELLNAFANYRSSAGAGYDEYYYGIFSPGASAQSFCGGGCVAGLGFVPGPGDAVLRAAIGLGFSGDLSPETAVHEVGHNHGRDHAPCGTSGDPGFPHSGAGIGVWGYDPTNMSLKNPQVYVDLMSYCSPTWVSDYNYNAFFNRIKAVNGTSFHVPEESRWLAYERITVSPFGTRWLDEARFERPPLGETRRITVSNADGTEEEIEAAFARYDHLDGGVYMFPRRERAITAVDLDVAGATVRVSRANVATRTLTPVAPTPAP